MPTGRQIVTAALLDLEAIAEGEVPSTAAATSGLDALNGLLDQYQAERLVIHTVTRTTWNLTTAGSYTVGTGGDVNIARPVFVDHVNLIDTSTDPDQEITLGELTDADYARIPLKAQTSAWPSHWYYNPTLPTGTLILWPAPTSASLQGAIYVPTALTEFADLNTDYSLPPGYRRMLVKNLALELASSYGKPASRELQMAASDAKATVKRSNQRFTDLQFEAAVLGSSRGAYDIYTG